MAQEIKAIATASAKGASAANEPPLPAAAKPAAPSIMPSARASPTPPPLPTLPSPTPSASEPDTDKRITARGAAAPARDAPKAAPADKPLTSDGEPPPRRQARRRAAGPARGPMAANDDSPSIGGLIYALEQKPTNTPFVYAGIASAIWLAIAAIFIWGMISAELQQGTTFAGMLFKPSSFITLASVLFPIAVLWFLALLSWRSDELRLRSSAMTEVAVRLAEPDRMAEQSVASLGQAVRRQVAFMNDAVSRALGRAGELEALVHNEVSALERSYEENERKIRALIGELAGERHAITNTSGQVAETLRQLGTDVPALIDKLSNQQLKLAHIIQGAGENLTALETAVGQSAGRLESTLGNRTQELQGVLESYTNALGSALGNRTEQLQGVLANYTTALATALGDRTENLQTVFEEYARALDTTFGARAQALDNQLIERTRALDHAFAERLRLFDESIKHSTLAIDSAVSDRALALTSALDKHAKTFSQTISQQTMQIDDSLMQGISAVRRTSENITRQSLKAIEGLAGQSDVLRNVSENILGQINSITGRFENQSQGIMRAANALETINYKIDQTLQNRYTDLNQTLDRMAGKADEFGRNVEGYQAIGGAPAPDMDARTRAAAHEALSGAEQRRREAMGDIERAHPQGDRAIEELRRRFSTVSNAVSEELDTLSNRYDASPEEIRIRTNRAASEIAAEQAWLREQMEQLPAATRDSADAMRRALSEQLRALEQLSTLTSRTAQAREGVPPLALTTGRPGPGAPGSEPYLADPQFQGGGTPLPAARAMPQTDASQRVGPVRGGQTAPRPAPGAPATGPQPRPTQLPPVGDMQSWSLGDLLARASLDEEHALTPHSGGGMPVPAGTSSEGYQLDVDVIARALDPATTAAIWSRLRAGQRGIMVRSIYSAEGRAAFDEVSRRIKTDPELARTINRYVTDFERIQAEAEAKDPSGRMVQNHLASDTGRVYLFLAHVSGRLS